MRLLCDAEHFPGLQLLSWKSLLERPWPDPFGEGGQVQQTSSKRLIRESPSLALRMDPTCVKEWKTERHERDAEGRGLPLLQAIRAHCDSLDPLQDLKHEPITCSRLEGRGALEAMIALQLVRNFYICPSLTLFISTSLTPFISTSI